MKIFWNVFLPGELRLMCHILFLVFEIPPYNRNSEMFKELSNKSGIIIDVINTALSDKHVICTCSIYMLCFVVVFLKLCRIAVHILCRSFPLIQLGFSLKTFQWGLFFNVVKSVRLKMSSSNNVRNFCE